MKVGTLVVKGVMRIKLISMFPIVVYIPKHKIPGYYFLLMAVLKLKRLCHHRVFLESLGLWPEPGAGIELNSLTVRARSSFKSASAALFKSILSWSFVFTALVYSISFLRMLNCKSKIL